MRPLSMTAASVVVLACVLPAGSVRSADVRETERATVRPVAGTGVHFLTTAIIHSTEFTETGMIQRSTETVDLGGDLTGRILYHPTSVFDFAAGTLVNTGHQVFSGTVLGSAPVMLHDDDFRFEVNLATGASAGKVYLADRIAGPRVRCELDIVGTGMTAEGNVSASYSGSCVFKDE